MLAQMKKKISFSNYAQKLHSSSKRNWNEIKKIAIYRDCETLNDFSPYLWSTPTDRHQNIVEAHVVTISKIHVSTILENMGTQLVYTRRNLSRIIQSVCSRRIDQVASWLICFSIS